jgi:hypothetical protein
MAKVTKKRSTPPRKASRDQAPPPESIDTVLSPGAAKLSIETWVPEVGGTRRQREQYQRKLAKEILGRLDPSTSRLAPRQLYDLFCKEFEDDPVVKKFKIAPPSFTTFLRAQGKKH